MDNSINTIDGYIDNFPEEIQKILQLIRATIRAAAPDAREKISYAIPTFELNGNLVHFAAFKNHIGFCPAPTGMDEFKKEFSVFLLYQIEKSQFYLLYI